jgi:hypothetical protein
MQMSIIKTLLYPHSPKGEGGILFTQENFQQQKNHKNTQGRLAVIIK